MHQNIHGTALGLVHWQRIGQFRIHNGKSTAAQIITVSPFDPTILVRNDRRPAHFTAGCGDRQHSADWKTSFCFPLSAIDVPYIPFIGNAIADPLC